MHWHIYGSTTPTNNDFMLWLVKGYITQEMRVEITWAKATTSIFKEKVQKKDVGRLKNGSIYLLDLNGGEAIT